MKKDNSKWLRKVLIILFWLAVWTLTAMNVNNKLLVATPYQTLQKLFTLSKEGWFWLTVARSCIRIAAGFLAGLAVGLILAALAAKCTLLEEVLEPFMKLVTAVPVASFVVLLLIWWGSSFLSVAICFLVVLPIIYNGTLAGIKSTNQALLEMAGVFRMPLSSVFFYVYRPALKPFLQSSLKVALGMCWKSGVAAEVIGTPDYSIGEKIYLSKVYLDTAGIFAWTVTIIILSVLFEKLFLRLTEIFFAWQPNCKRAAIRRDKDPSDVGIQLLDVCKSYGELSVLSHENICYANNETYVLTEPSGSGKTTRLRLIAGLEKPDSGKIICGSASVLFQEDRLCRDYSAVKNVELVTGDRAQARAALEKVLPSECLEKPCSQLSGGMKRRVALVRAVEAESDCLLLDEPYNGLDEETISLVKNYIEGGRKGRTVLVASHISI